MAKSAQSRLERASAHPTRPETGPRAAQAREAGTETAPRAPGTAAGGFEADANGIDREILGQALAQTSEGVLILNRDLRVSYANAAFCRRIGHGAQGLVGKPFAALGPAPLKGMPRDPAAFEAWIGERGSASGEVVMRSRSGVAFPAYMTIAPVQDAWGGIVAYVATHLDLRRAKLAETRLRESVEMLRAMSTAAQDAMMMLDDAGSIAFWNEAAGRMFGHSAKEALGQNAHLLLAPARYHEAYRAAWRKFTQPGDGPVVGKTLELEALRKDGAEFPIELSVAPVLLKGRWHAVGIVRDITERKQTERNLRLFRDLLDNSNDAIEVIDPDTMRFLDVNDKGCRDLGYSREDLLSMGIGDIDPNFNSASVERVNEQIRRSGAAIFETLHRRKDGSTFPVEISLRYVESGEKTYGLSIARDVSERKRAEESLRRSNRALRTISVCNATVIHATRERQLLADMCRTVVEQGGYRMAWIGLTARGANGRARHVAAIASEAQRPASLPAEWVEIESGQCPAGRALREATPQIAEDILADPRCVSWRAHARRCGYASCIALPLKEEDGAVFGVLNICAAEPGAFDADEIGLLQGLAGDVAFGVLNLRTRGQRDHYQKENLKTLDQLKKALLGTIHSIALMVDKRDPYTAGHQKRVADLTCAMARELELDAGRIEGMRLGALIHDIGKISIPAEILNRPGKLSEPELEIVKLHVQAGYEIIKDIDFPVVSQFETPPS